MLKRIVSFLILLNVFSLMIFAQQVNDEDKENRDIENSAQIKYEPRVSDYFVAFGEEALIELFGEAFVNLRSPRPQGLNFDSIIYSITKQPYVWDKTSFEQNQFVHPYAGNLYFNAARANNLDFWTSAAYTAWGAWSWENIYENSVTSWNDLITTTAAGVITGEAFHRLSYAAGAIWEPLLWVVSPIDGINRLLRGERYRHTAPENLEVIYAAELLTACSASERFASGSGQFSSYALFHPYIIYQNPFGHKSKEPFDQFTVDAMFMTNFYNSNTGYVEIDGALYSWPFFCNTDLPSSVGINLNYKVNYFDRLNYSTNAVGIFLRQKIPFNKDNVEKNYLWWNAEADFVFLETSKVDNVNYYNIGPEAKLEFGLETEKIAVRISGEFDYIFPQNVWHNKDFAGIDFKILPWLCVGVEDMLICTEGDVRNFTSVGVKVRK